MTGIDKLVTCLLGMSSMNVISQKFVQNINAKAFSVKSPYFGVADFAFARVA